MIGDLLSLHWADFVAFVVASNKGGAVVVGRKPGKNEKNEEEEEDEEKEVDDVAGAGAGADDGKARESLPSTEFDLETSRGPAKSIEVEHFKACRKRSTA